MWKVDIEDGGDVDVWADADRTQLAQPADWPAWRGCIWVGWAESRCYCECLGVERGAVDRVNVVVVEGCCNGTGPG